MRLVYVVGVALTVWAPTVRAHEFWIEPLTYKVQQGDEIALDLRVGQMLDGRSYPYLSHKFARYQVTDVRGVHDLVADEGDLPSMAYDATVPGLHVIVYDAVAEKIAYDDFQDFAEYVQEEGLSFVIARHRERGLPMTGFTEAYIRNAKTLVQVGTSAEGISDYATGMDFELVALENPYAGGDVLPVRLLWQGEKVQKAQVAVFQRNPSGDVIRTTHQTDAEGVANIPVTAAGMYLLSAVHLEESAAADGAVWTSTWASLSFGLEAGDAR